jgi:acyl-CoA synthetase (AMP-forming)/AMP-acid ligase II/thioesterase domain-containing protein/acyl carrier protein
MPHTTIYQLVATQAQQHPDAVAFQAPDRSPLTYSELLAQMDWTIAALRTMGLEHGERVAIVLPNGPEFPVAFYSVSSCCISVPLNPNYSASEFQQYFQEVNVKALIIQADLNSAAKIVADAIGLLTIELTPLETAGCFKFRASDRFDPDTFTPSTPAADWLTEPDEPVLILRTSGTTARPKIVPLTSINLCTAASNVAVSLGLRASDRSLSIMPLFHAQGLISVLLSSITVGASVICLPGIDQLNFCRWLHEFQPTWYAAVPAIQQAVLATVKAAPDAFRTSSIRLIRVASALLSEQVLLDLEATFGALVVEAYGLTEAYQLTCNPTSIEHRKIGSVGIATNVEIRILDEAGNPLPAGQVGEVVVQGDNVFSGYENNLEANQAAFIDGWFRTGDLGYLDAEGFLFLKGRVKELINRGGEKVSPYEVDQVLSEHPSVAQAATFGVPHVRLGEDVAAAIVLKPQTSVTTEEIREFAAKHLAAFKVPSQIVAVSEIPRNPTGKILRTTLADTLIDHLKIVYIEPRNHREQMLATIWSEVLNVARVGIKDNFFALGGDSLQAMTLLVRIEQAIDKKLPSDTLFKALTIEKLAQQISQLNHAVEWSSLVAIQPEGQKPPIFAVHDVSGHVVCYRQLAQYLGSEQPLYGLQAQGIDGAVAPLDCIETMATQYLQAIRQVQPEGPYFLLGLSFGGLVAFEMAQQLHQQHEQVGFLALLDTFAAGDVKPFPLLKKLSQHARYFLQTGPSYLTDRVVHHLKRVRRTQSPEVTALPSHLPVEMQTDHVQAAVLLAHHQAKESYTPKIYPGQITFFQPLERHLYQEWCNFDPLECWSPRSQQPLAVQEVPGGHSEMVREPHVPLLAAKLRHCLAQITDCKPAQFNRTDRSHSGDSLVYPTSVRR